MVLGLMVTFGVAVLCWLTNATIYALILIPAVQVIVLIATLILSFVMVRRIERDERGRCPDYVPDFFSPVRLHPCPSIC